MQCSGGPCQGRKPQPLFPDVEADVHKYNETRSKTLKLTCSLRMLEGQHASQSFGQPHFHVFFGSCSSKYEFLTLHRVVEPVGVLTVNRIQSGLDVEFWPTIPCLVVSLTSPRDE